MINVTKICSSFRIHPKWKITTNDIKSGQVIHSQIVKIHFTNLFILLMIKISLGKNSFFYLLLILNAESQKLKETLLTMTALNDPSRLMISYHWKCSNCLREQPISLRNSSCSHPDNSLWTILTVKHFISLSVTFKIKG